MCDDSFINMCSGDALFATEDPQPSDLLPIDDRNWAEDVTICIPKTSVVLYDKKSSLYPPQQASLYQLPRISQWGPLPANAKFYISLVEFSGMSTILRRIQRSMQRRASN
jgi:hypothetical protein